MIDNDDRVCSVNDVAAQSDNDNSDVLQMM